MTHQVQPQLMHHNLRSIRRRPLDQRRKPLLQPPQQLLLKLQNLLLPQSLQTIHLRLNASTFVGRESSNGSTFLLASRTTHTPRRDRRETAHNCSISSENNRSACSLSNSLF